MAITGTTELGNALLTLTVDADPRVTAVDAPAGSKIIFKGTDTAAIRNGDTFRKLDDGSTTNVSESSLKNSFSETTDPGVSDDNTKDYQVGSRWINVTLDKEFVCLDAATGAAVWTQTTASGATDADAIHDNVAGEIAAITEKTTLVDADLFLIEDSEDSNNKKRVQVVNLPSGGSSLPVVDTTGIAKGSADATKIVRFEVDGLTTGTTRVLTVPDKDITLVGLADVVLRDGTQTLTGDWNVGGNQITGLTGLDPNGDGVNDLGTDDNAWGTLRIRNVRPDVGQTLTLLSEDGIAKVQVDTNGVTLLSKTSAVGAQVTIPQINGSDPVDNTTAFDSRKLGFENRVWSGSAAVTRTFWIRNEGVININEGMRLIFSSDQGDGTERDFQSHRDLGAIVQSHAPNHTWSFLGGDGLTTFTIAASGRTIDFFGPVDLQDDDPLRIGSSNDNIFQHDTAQTNDGLLLGLAGTEGNYFLITDKARIGVDRGLPTFSNPTLVIEDGGVSSGNWGSIAHDGTNLVITTNAGDISVAAKQIIGLTGLDPNGDGVDDIGTDANAWGTIRIRNVRPDANQALNIRDQSGAARITLSSSTSLMTVSATMKLVDASVLQIGTGGDTELQYDTAQTNNGLLWGMQGAEGNYLLITDKARIGVDRALPTFSTPTVVFEDGGVASGKWGSITHDGTNLVITTNAGAGDISVAAKQIIGLTGLDPNGNGVDDLGTDANGWRTLRVMNVRTNTGQDLNLRTDNGTIALTVTSTELVINDTGMDRDFRVEGDNDPDLLTADAGLDRAGVGVALGTHLAKFHVAGGILGEYDVEAVAATPHTVLAAEPRRVFTNEGATAQIVHNLPTATAGLTYTYIVQDTDGIQVNAATGDTLRIGGTVSAAAGRIEAATIGDVVTIVAINATEWIGFSREGTWTVDGSAVAGWLHSDGSVPLTADWNTGAFDILTNAVRARSAQDLVLKEDDGTEIIKILVGGTVTVAQDFEPVTDISSKSGDVAKRWLAVYALNYRSPDDLNQMVIDNTGVQVLTDQSGGKFEIQDLAGVMRLQIFEQDDDSVSFKLGSAPGSMIFRQSDGTILLRINGNATKIVHHARTEPNAADTITMGLTGLPYQEVFTNILTPGTGQSLLLQDAGGTARVTVASDGDLTVNPPNDWTLQIGGSARMLVTSTLTTFNSAGADHDHIFQGDTDATLVVFNAGVDRVGIGVDPVSIDAKLVVEGTVKLKEQNTAQADTTAYGQFWVRDDGPNTPMFTDDVGTDFVLNAGGDPTSDIAEATGDITTTSGTDVLATSMTITPASGTYLVWFSGAVDHSANNANIQLSIYDGGTIQASSEREFARGAGQGNISTPFCCSAKVTVNGSQAIEGRWRTSTSTATMHERTLKILKVA